MQSVHEGIIAKLKSLSQAADSPVSIMTSLLSISKEGAYRRLRGEILLTLEEAIILAKKLEISIDSLMEVKSNEKFSFHISPFTLRSSLDGYYQTLTDIMNSYNHVSSDPHAYTYIAGKVFSPVFYFKYHEFTKLTFFKWIYLVQNGTMHASLSDVIIPPKFEQLYQPFIDAATKVATTYILNDFMFTSIEKDLDYFLTIRLFTPEDVEILQQQMLQIIDDLEEIAINGRYENGARVSIYIADTYLDASYHYIKGNGFEACGIGAYGLNFLSCVNNQIAESYKIWIESLIKYSTFISQSGETQRLAFFKRQRARFSH